MSQVPEVRANWLKYTVRSAKNYHPAPASARVLRSIGDELRSSIRVAGPLAWQPAEQFIELCTAVRVALGVAGAREFWRWSLNSSINEPFMRPLASGALYLFGRTPAALYRRTPQAWALVTRGAGQMSTDPGPHPDSLWIRVYGLPASCRSMDLLHMWEGGFAGEADFVDCDAQVQTDARALEVGAADFLVTWKQRPQRNKSGGPDAKT
jgi:hypothetical protein